MPTVSLGALWLPIILSAVLVFVASSIIHMVLGYHQRDYTPLPNEDAVRAAIRSGNPPPKQYIFPYCANPKEMSSPEMQRKYVEGPVGVLNLRPAGVPGMGPSLGQWFVFTLVVSFFVAYVACHALPAGSALSQGVSGGGGSRVPRLRRGAASGGDLDGEAVGGGVERGFRRAGVRAADGWDVRVAVAAVRRGSRGESSHPERSEGGMP